MKKSGRPNNYAIGDVINQLTLLEYETRQSGKKFKGYWKVRCTCGTVTEKRADQIKIGMCIYCSRQIQANKMLGKNKGQNHKRWIQDRKEVSLRKKIQSYIKHGKSKYNLTIEQIRELILENCHYCGQESKILEEEYGKWPKHLNGIDRLDSSKEYVIENCVSCCWTCNNMKHTSTVQEFINHAKKIARYNSQRL